MKNMKWLIILLVVLQFIALKSISIAQSDEKLSKENRIINSLAEIIPENPSVINQQALDLMNQVANTRRLDAAILLIKSLVFNFNPANSNEMRSQDMMIPAINLLKDNFGEAVVPLLYTEAIGADQKWYRDRIVLTIRAILSQSEIRKMNAVFSLDLTINANAKDFSASLVADELDIHYAIPEEELINRVDEAVKKILKR